MDIESRVKKGIEFLNQKSPGWQANIDPNKLKMWSNTNCLLCQVTKKQYGDACKELQLHPHGKQAIECGFFTEAISTTPTEDYVKEENELRAAFLKAIETGESDASRQESDPPKDL